MKKLPYPSALLVKKLQTYLQQLMITKETA